MPGSRISPVVAIGGSAGSITPLRQLVSTLPRMFDAAVLVSIHMWPSAKSVLPELLSRTGPLPASHAADGMPVERGRIYIAPPDRHLMIQNSCLRLSYGPRENRHRPSIDVLFRSVAMARGAQTIGVLLSGADDDGAAGLSLIRRLGGVAIVQDPQEALFTEMPLSAMRNFDPDYTLPVAEIGPTLADLVGKLAELREKVTMPESDPGPREQIPEANEQQLGLPSAFTCPDCGGALWELEEGELIRYRCRVGHAFSPSAMLTAEADVVERALWTATRALKESAAVCRRIAAQTGLPNEEFSKRAEEREHYAGVIHDLLERGVFRL